MQVQWQGIAKEEEPARRTSGPAAEQHGERSMGNIMRKNEMLSVGK
jgi:hypothetical protein